MELWGVTSDKLGHLFMCDYKNKCIQMFSLDTGLHLGIQLTTYIFQKNRTQALVLCLNDGKGKRETCSSCHQHKELIHS